MRAGSAIPGTQLSPWQLIIASLVMIAAGMMLILRGLGIITAGEIYAPPWVLVVVGLVPLLPGLVYLAWGISEVIAPHRANVRETILRRERSLLILGVVIITLFAIISTAAAVYSWYPEYAAGFESNTSADRIVWALAAVILDSIVLALWGYVIVELLHHYVYPRRR